MNPLMIMAAIGGAALGLSMLMRKTNAAVQWVTRYWAGLEQLPADYRPTPDTVHADLSDGATPTFNPNGSVTLRDVVGAQFYAPVDCVVVTMNPIPGRAGQIMGLSHLTQQGESSILVGLMPLVGLGQIVLKGRPLGSADTAAVTFTVKAATIPANAARNVELGSWFAVNNVSTGPRV